MSWALGLGFRAQGSGFGAEGLEPDSSGLGFRV